MRNIDRWNQKPIEVELSELLYAFRLIVLSRKGLEKFKCADWYNWSIGEEFWLLL